MRAETFARVRNLDPYTKTIFNPTAIIILSLIMKHHCFAVYRGVLIIKILELVLIIKLIQKSFDISVSA